MVLWVTLEWLFVALAYMKTCRQDFGTQWIKLICKWFFGVLEVRIWTTVLFAVYMAVVTAWKRASP